MRGLSQRIAALSCCLTILGRVRAWSRRSLLQADTAGRFPRNGNSTIPCRKLSLHFACNAPCTVFCTSYPSLAPFCPLFFSRPSPAGLDDSCLSPLHCCFKSKRTRRKRVPAARHSLFSPGVVHEGPLNACVAVLVGTEQRLGSGERGRKN